MTAILYGIKSCDRVRAARAWLDTHAIPYRFHDFREDGVPLPELKAWCAALGWETLLNRRGTTWRQLPENRKTNLDASTGLSLLQEQPTLITRPLLSYNGQYRVGFNPDDYRQWLAQ